MNKVNIYKVRPTEVAILLQRHEEEKLNELLILGLDKGTVDQLRFDQKHKLDLPSNPLLSKLTRVLAVLFSYSDKIHNDVLYEVGKGILEINLQDIVANETEDEAIMSIANQVIMEVVIKKMEILYYFYEDEVFSSLVFDLCCLLDLKAENYGFNKEDRHERN